MGKTNRFIINTFTATSMPSIEEGCLSATHTGVARLSPVSNSKKKSSFKAVVEQEIKIKSFDSKILPGIFKRIGDYFIPVKKTREGVTFAA